MTTRSRGKDDNDDDYDDNNGDIVMARVRIGGWCYNGHCKLLFIVRLKSSAICTLPLDSSREEAEKKIVNDREISPVKYYAKFNSVTSTLEWTQKLWLFMTREYNVAVSLGCGRVTCVCGCPATGRSCH